MPHSAADIQVWFINYLSQLTQIDPQAIDIRESFENYSLGSVEALTLSGDLENWLGVELSPMLLYSYPTIEALAQYLSLQSESLKADPQLQWRSNDLEQVLTNIEQMPEEEAVKALRAEDQEKE